RLACGLDRSTVRSRDLGEAVGQARNDGADRRAHARDTFTKPPISVPRRGRRASPLRPTTDIHEATYDKRLTASCAYWRNATNLDQAQEDKLELICRKIGLRSHHSVLDIGC